MNQNIFFTFLIILCTFSSCKKVKKASSPADLMSKLEIALASKDAKTIEKYLITDSIRTPEMAQALSELIVAIKNPTHKHHFANLPQPSLNIMLNLLINNEFSYLKNGKYNEQLEELKVETKVANPTNTSTVTVVDIVTVKKTNNGFKFWPYAIDNSAIIYTNEVYKRIPEAISTDSITQIKNINRLLELYVPEEDRTLRE
ncbi:MULTISPECIES: hypothetical protein [unclassified Lacinutrix]